MSDTATKPTTTGPGGPDLAQRSDDQPAPHPSSALDRSGSSELVTEHGRTSIASSVVSKVAGVAAREIEGVYDMGGSGSRAVGAVRERVGQTAHAQGVKVEVGERQAAVDLVIVVEYGVSIIDLSQGVRDNVIESVERMTGLEVTEVNIDVTDVHIAGATDEDSRPDPPRVQ